MRWNLRSKLLVPPLAVLLALAAATAWAASHAAAEAERRIQLQIDAVAATLAGPPTFPLTERVVEQIGKLSGAEIVVLLRDGERIVTKPGLSEAVPESDYARRQVELPAGHPNSGAAVWILYSEQLRRQALRDAVRPTLGLGLAGAAAGAGLAALLAARLVRRIRRVEFETRRIAGGDFSPAPTDSSTDELADLSRAVNELAGKLAQYREELAAAERLRVLGTVAGGLAHQLRNTAAGARLAIQLHLAEQPPTDAEPLAVALKQLDRAEAILRQFLDLGKPAPQKSETLNFSEIVREQVELLQAQALHAGTELQTDIGDHVMIHGDADALGHLAGNLIGNALEAAGPGGQVQVVLDPETLTIGDSGPGVPSELLPRLFTPFATARPGGVGLGLAVAHRAATAHAGTLTYSRENEQTRFRFTFATAATARPSESRSA
jgi:signal transduction histidine kinase